MKAPAARRTTVLFLCRGNSARSQMAEALLRHHARDRFHVLSAGLEARPVHPLTLEVLRERGIDVAGLRSKSIREFLGKEMLHRVIIVCAAAQRNCPSLYPFALEVETWPFDDPAEAGGGDEERLLRFRRVRDAIEERILAFLAEGDA